MSVQIFALAILAGLSLLLFIPLDMRKPRYLRKPWLERHIPFVPSFIFPYLSLFPYVVFVFFTMLYFTPVAAHLYVSLIVAGLTAALIWYFFPIGVADRPRIVVRGLVMRLVALTYALDKRDNAIPSSHVYLAFLSSYYLAYVYPTYEIAIWAYGTTIISSTLLIKQYHVVDIVAGLTLAIAAIGVANFLLGAVAL